jgi:hypothetical protein
MNEAIGRDTERGWSLKLSPASMDASSITQAPCSGDECLPLVSLIVWWLIGGMWTSS